ncbi:MAG: protein kinase [Deltaproteobacteria bacterium]|nr:protein kinase [Deltaproteobacteria bacterium]
MIASTLRLLFLLLALVLIGAGAVGVLLQRSASDPQLREHRRRIEGLAGQSMLPPEALRGWTPFALVGAGTGLAIGVLLVARRRDASAPHGRGGSAKGAAARGRAPELEPALDRRTGRKLERQALAMAKKGLPQEAAELCFDAGLLDRAAELFVEAGDFVRAAGIRHDQNRFLEAAELHLKAGDHDTAGTILAAQGEHRRAAESFLAARRMSVAAEMFEKAGDHRRAGDCYREAGFERQAARAYIRCQSWKQAAESLEEVILEERTRTGTGQNPREQRELQTLVLQAGRLYDQAGLLDKSAEVLEKGGCHVAAAEVRLRKGDLERAAELFLQGSQPVRAAEALQQLGDAQNAARILGEYHRARGEDAEAAHHLELAGEFFAAGDVYRKLEDYARAAQAYDKANDRVQAAEMFRLAGHPGHAAQCFEKASRWDEAASCWAEAGDAARQAHALVQAGRHFAAGEAYHAQGADEEAIKVLQQIPASSPDFALASAVLGEIFQRRGQLSLAIKKLRQAVGTGDLDRHNLRLYYALAQAYESHGELREAADLYEKILACDYHFEDAGARLQAAKERLAQDGAAEAAAVEEAPLSVTARKGPVARYQILSELGRGGMGIVYKANDTVLDRVVAFKVLPAALEENPQALKNFLREAKSAAQLNHPNIVTVYDAGEQDRRYYIAMEYVDGNTLKEIVRRRGAIAPGGVLHVLVQMCEALAYAHEKKIVHRDIKTANTMWTRDRKAKIMDFGLAKVVEEVRNHTTLVSGTPYYMSPEQTLGRNVDHRTDLYSLGVTVFELATGRLPFTEGNIPYHHVHTPPPDPREIHPEVPTLLAEIIARCLRKDPAERYQSARDILAEVRAAVGRGRPGAQT